MTSVFQQLFFSTMRKSRKIEKNDISEIKTASNVSNTIRKLGVAPRSAKRLCFFHVKGKVSPVEKKLFVRKAVSECLRVFRRQRWQSGGLRKCITAPEVRLYLRKHLKVLKISEKWIPKERQLQNILRTFPQEERQRIFRIPFRKKKN